MLWCCAVLPCGAVGSCALRCGGGAVAVVSCSSFELRRAMAGAQGEVMASDGRIARRELLSAGSCAQGILRRAVV